MIFKELPYLKNLTKHSFGTKAYNLWKLHKLKMNIPRTFLLPTEIVDSILFPWEKKNKKLISKYKNSPLKLKSALFENLQNNFLHSKCVSQKIDKLKNEITTLLILMNPIAVRSSSTLEDSLSHTSAGNFYTELNIRTTKDAITAIKKCIISKYNPMIHYSKNIKLGIIIQEYINFRFSGVLFNQNPVNDKFSSLIEIVYGNPDKLVSGKTNSISYEFDPDTLNLIKRNGNDKKKLICENQLKTFILTSLNFELKLNSKKPLEFEWGFKNNKFIYLQFRYITASNIRKKLPHKINDKISNGTHPLSPFAISLIKTSNRLSFLVGKLFYKRIKRFFINGFQYSTAFKNKNFNFIKNLFIIIITFISYSIFKFINNFNLSTYKKLSSSNYKPEKNLKLVLIKVILSRLLLDILWMSSAHFFKLLKNFIVLHYNFPKDKITSFLSSIKGFKDEVMEYNRKFNDLLKNKYDVTKFITEYPYTFSDRDDIHDPLRWKTFFENKSRFLTKLYKLKNIPVKNLKIPPNINKSNLIHKYKIFLFFRLKYYVLLYKFSILIRNNRDIYHLRTLAMLRLHLLKFNTKYNFSVNDMLFLTISELWRINSINIKNIIIARKWLYKQERKISISDYKIKLSKQSTNKKNFLTLSNAAAVKGEILISNDLNFAINNITKNTILVTKEITPDWSIIFPFIKGLIIRKGSVLSHSAILAREYNIPAILYGNSVDKLKNNDIIYLDTENNELEIRNKQ